MNGSDRFPAEFSPGEKALLTAFEMMQRETREVQRVEHSEYQLRLETMNREMKIMASALNAGYPNGDAHAHRRFHEALIRKAEERGNFYRKLTASLAEKGIWAALAILGIALWHYVKTKIAP